MSGTNTDQAEGSRTFSRAFDESEGMNPVFTRFIESQLSSAGTRGRPVGGLTRLGLLDEKEEEKKSKGSQTSGSREMFSTSPGDRKQAGTSDRTSTGTVLNDIGAREPSRGRESGRSSRYRGDFKHDPDSRQQSGRQPRTNSRSRSQHKITRQLSRRHSPSHLDSSSPKRDPTTSNQVSHRADSEYTRIPIQVASSEPRQQRRVDSAHPHVPGCYAYQHPGIPFASSNPPAMFPAQPRTTVTALDSRWLMQPAFVPVPVANLQPFVQSAFDDPVYAPPGPVEQPYEMPTHERHQAPTMAQAPVHRQFIPLHYLDSFYGDEPLAERETWWARYMYIARGGEWENQEKSQNLFLYLKGPALSWYRQLDPRRRDWQSLVELFREEFLTPTMPAYERYVSMTQGRNETARQFLWRLNSAAREAYIPLHEPQGMEDHVNRLVQGLKDQAVRAMLADAVVASSEELEQRLKLYERRTRSRNQHDKESTAPRERNLRERDQDQVRDPDCDLAGGRDRDRERSSSKGLPASTSRTFRSEYKENEYRRRNDHDDDRRVQFQPGDELGDEDAIAEAGSTYLATRSFQQTSIHLSKSKQRPPGLSAQQRWKSNSAPGSPPPPCHPGAATGASRSGVCSECEDPNHWASQCPVQVTKLAQPACSLCDDFHAPEYCWKRCSACALVHEDPKECKVNKALAGFKSWYIANGAAGLEVPVPAALLQLLKLGSSPGFRDPVRDELQPQPKVAPASNNAEPVAKVLHVYAYVGVGPNTNESPTSHHKKNEARSYVVKSNDSNGVDWRAPFHLQLHERRGWWSTPRPVDQAGIALVHGAVCNQRVRILLDSGSDTSILSLDLARRLGLELSFKERLKVKGIGGVTTYVTARAHVKLTIGASVVYYFDIWCGNIGEGMECLLGMDFMISAGVRLSAYDGIARLPDEENVPLMSPSVRPKFPKRSPVCVQDDIYIAAGFSAVVPIIYGRDDQNLVPWLCRGKGWLTTLLTNNQSRPTGIRVVNISNDQVCIKLHTLVGHLVEQGHLPNGGKCVRAGSTKYEEWQQLIYENAHSRQFARRVDHATNVHNLGLPAAVPRSSYPAPIKILARGESLGPGSTPKPAPPVRTVLTGVASQAGAECYHAKDAAVGHQSHTGPAPAIPMERTCPTQVAQKPHRETVMTVGCARVSKATASTPLPGLSTSTNNQGPGLKPVSKLASTFKVVAEASTEEPTNHTTYGDASVFFNEGKAFVMRDELRDELAILPGFDTKPAPADTASSDAGKPNKNSPEELAQSILEMRKPAFIRSVNALPLSTRGVIRDIELVPGAKMIARCMWRTKSHLLSKENDLFKLLLDVSIIEYSDSVWTSPIAAAVKQNGEDIRLCIDYRLVNQLNILTKYPVPLIDQLLDDFEAVRHVWGCICLPPELESEVDTEVLEGVGIGPAKVAPPSCEMLQALQSDSGAADPVLAVFQRALPSPPCMNMVLGSSSYTDGICAETKTGNQLCDAMDKLIYRVRWKNCHKLIGDYSVIATVLYELTDEKLRYGGDLDRAKLCFDLLKETREPPPILRHPGKSKPYSIVLHSNNGRTSAILAQECDGRSYPVHFRGRTFQVAVLRYRESPKEVQALRRAFAPCYTLVAGHELPIHTRLSILKSILISKSGDYCTVITGDSRIIFQQCLGAINRNSVHLRLLSDQFEELKAGSRSVRPVHVEQEVNGAEYLTGPAHRSGKAVILEQAKLLQLVHLNQLSSPFRTLAPAQTDPATQPAPAEGGPAAKPAPVAKLTPAECNPVMKQSTAVKPTPDELDPVVNPAEYDPVMNHDLASKPAPAESNSASPMAAVFALNPRNQTATPVALRTDVVEEWWKRIHASQIPDPGISVMRRSLEGDLATLSEQQTGSRTNVAEHLVLHKQDVLRHADGKRSERAATRGDEFTDEAQQEVRWGRTRAGCRVREYPVRWHGHETRSLEHVRRLQCGRFLHEFGRNARGRARFAAVRVGDDTTIDN